MLKEFLWGTPQEINADKRLQELQAKPKLTPKQQEELAQSKHLSRRLFLRRSATVVGVAVLLSSPVVGLILEQASKIGEEEELFLYELDQLSTNEQAKRIDDYYSRRKLNVETARKKVVPVWVKNYLGNSGSNLAQEELLSNIILFTNKDRTPEQEKIEFGQVRIKPQDRYKGPVEINFSRFTSNISTRHETDPNFIAPGIIFLKSEVAHEISHFDTTFRDDPALGKIINDNALYPTPISNPGPLIVNGFSFFTIAPDKSYAVFFAKFDEIATDTIASYILNKSGQAMIFGYTQADVFRDFLDWIKFPSNKVIEYHRNSDLRSFAKDLGHSSGRFTKTASESDEDSIVKGIKIMQIFNSGKPQEMENFFPGFMNNVMDRPPSLIR